MFRICLFVCFVVNFLTLIQFMAFVMMYGSTLQQPSICALPRCTRPAFVVRPHGCVTLLAACCCMDVCLVHSRLRLSSARLDHAGWDNGVARMKKTAECMFPKPVCRTVSETLRSTVCGRRANPGSPDAPVLAPQHFERFYRCRSYAKAPMPNHSFSGEWRQYFAAPCAADS